MKNRRKIDGKSIPKWLHFGLWERLGGLLGRLEANLVANMAPTWPPDGVQVGPKSTKIEPILERLLRRVFGDFGGPVHVYWTSSRSVLRRIGVGYYELLPSDELRIWSFSYTSLCEIASGS